MIMYITRRVVVYGEIISCLFQSVSPCFLLRNLHQNLTEIENRRILLLSYGFRKTDLGINFIANAFRGLIQNTRLFSIFSLFIFCSITYLFEKRKWAYSSLPSNDRLDYSLSLFKGWFHVWSSVQHKMLLVRLHVYRSL